VHFLFCCELYYPSVGGVQEVMRQIAERLVKRGHSVTVATSKLAAGQVAEHNGVKIEPFAITGNEARGIEGEVDRFRDFVVAFPGDAILIKAAQQWTFDALLPVLDRIKARKLFIPCGFSGLYEPLYRGYYERLPAFLRAFDHLIFYAEKYRDVDFCRAQGLSNLRFLPNGASEEEFAATRSATDFREKHGIPGDNFLFSTVGSVTGLKGHHEVAEAFSRLQNGTRGVTLVLNGNIYRDAASTPAGPVLCLPERFIAFVRREGVWRALAAAARVAGRLRRKKNTDISLPDLVRRIRLQPQKQVLTTDLPRAGVIDLFKSSDLFVFASNVEYSPLVLYESAAAGTPFLTVPVGNAAEIAANTQGGVVCPADTDAYGYTRVDPSRLAMIMLQLMNDPAQLAQLGQAARHNWEKTFTWEKIAAGYEALLAAPVAKPVAASQPDEKRPAISILLPVHNGGATLGLAVKSILSQTLADFELLLIDDGSTDNAIDRIRALNDPRVRILGDAARRGLSARLNEGIDAARAPYIARMDADDVSFPKRLEKQAHFLGAHKDVDLVGCRALVFRSGEAGRGLTRSGGDIIGLLPFAARHEALCARPWRGIPLPHPTWMGRADWFRRWRYATPEVARAEDQDLLLRAHADSRYACLPDVLLGYRQGPFDLRKTLTARRHLALAQQRYFLAHKEWGQMALNAAATTAKAALDLVAALPGCDALFFARMGASVPDEVARDFDRARKRS
jgi:glycosyltransferase involved in cell wall biosynthesis